MKEKHLLHSLYNGVVVCCCVSSKDDRLNDIGCDGVNESEDREHSGSDQRGPLSKRDQFNRKSEDCCQTTEEALEKVQLDEPPTTLQSPGFLDVLDHSLFPHVVLDGLDPEYELVNQTNAPVCSSPYGQTDSNLERP